MNRTFDSAVEVDMNVSVWQSMRARILALVIGLQHAHIGQGMVEGGSQLRFRAGVEIARCGKEFIDTPAAGHSLAADGRHDARGYF